VITLGQRGALKPAARALYIRRGRIVVAQDGSVTVLTADDCALFFGAATLVGDGTVWSREATRDRHPPDPLRTVVHVRLPRDPNAPMLLRADRVDFPQGAVTPRYGHAGPGISGLLNDRLFAEIGETHRRIDAGEAWFESGLEPMVGHNIAPASAVFRCMLLDLELLGRPTFRPTPAGGRRQAARVRLPSVLRHHRHSAALSDCLGSQA
jgi:hypothetical protein